MVDMAIYVADWTGLKFKPLKCAYQTLSPNNSHIIVNQIQIPKILEDQSQKYLGVEFSKKLKTTLELLFKNVVKDLRASASSIFFPWQIIGIYIIFLHSRCQYAFRNFNISIRELDRYGHLEVQNAIFKKGLDSKSAKSSTR